jgi:hypothetical protein
MVTVEWMPVHLRASHKAAGNSGCYPANGAQRIAVSLPCANAMIEHDGEWVRIVGVKEVADVLRVWGEVWTGGRPEEVAAEWVAAGITDPDEVSGWCGAKVWEPKVAAALRSVGITPHRLESIVDRLTRGLTMEERESKWTDGCLVYSVCNGDSPVSTIISADAE